MGSQALADASEPNSTVSKIRRYATFFLDFTDAAKKATWYSQAFADGFKPELVFLTNSEARRDSIRKVIASEPRAAGKIAAGALTIREAAQKYRSAVRLPEPPPEKKESVGSPREILPADAAILERYLAESVQIIKQVRHTIRAQKAPAEPSYPASYSEMAALVERLKKSAG